MRVIENPELRFRKIWLAIGYGMIGVVILLSVMSDPPTPDIDLPSIDKLYHTLTYFLLMIWFAQIYHVNKQKYLWALFFIILGVALEYIQNYSPERYFELSDMVANTVGVIVGILLAGTALRNALVRIERSL